MAKTTSSDKYKVSHRIVQLVVTTIIIILALALGVFKDAYLYVVGVQAHGTVTSETEIGQRRFRVHGGSYTGYIGEYVVALAQPNKMSVEVSGPSGIWDGYTYPINSQLNVVMTRDGKVAYAGTKSDLLLNLEIFAGITGFILLMCSPWLRPLRKRISVRWQKITDISSLSKSI